VTLSMHEIDVSRLQPEAQSIAQAAAVVYLRQSLPHFVGLIAHGSGLKGGVIPCCSDLDLQLYLDPAAFDAGGRLSFEQSLAIARDLAGINPCPFAYIQCFAWPCSLPEGYVGPIPGAYAVLAGWLPVPEASAVALQAGARRLLDKPNFLPSDLVPSLLDSSPRHIERRARLICTDVWPTLYSMLSLQHDDPICIWNLPKHEAMALLPENSQVGEAIRQFYTALQTYYPAQRSPERGLDVVACGVAFLRAARAWWEEWRKERTDR
jgi:hypothetical protein